MFSYIKGSCLKMCPESELQLREREGLLHPLEQQRGLEQNVRRPPADWARTVKRYSRSAAGQAAPLPCDIRPPHVLHETVLYLFNEIVPSNEVAWIVVYNFVFDRLRAVRQDMVMQGISGSHCISVLEAIVRFHVYSAYRLCEQPVSKYDPHINHTHLLECLKQLLIIYDEDESTQHIHRHEMEALYLVLNLGHAKALHRAFHIAGKLRTSPIEELALQMSLSFFLGNYVGVCKIMRRLPLLLACTAALHLPQIRRSALRTMSVAYNCKKAEFPISKLKDLLLYENSAAVVSECSYYNIPQGEGEMVMFNKAMFSADAKACPVQKVAFVDVHFNTCSIPNFLIHSECKES